MKRFLFLSFRGFKRLDSMGISSLALNTPTISPYTPSKFSTDKSCGSAQVRRLYKYCQKIYYQLFLDAKKRSCLQFRLNKSLYELAADHCPSCTVFPNNRDRIMSSVQGSF